MEVPEDLFRADSHLNEEAVALYVDALKLGRLHLLPKSMLDHVGRCETCKEEVTGLFSLLVEEDYSQFTSHPFLKEPDTATRLRVPTILRMAAIIVAVIGVGAIVVALFMRGIDKDSAVPGVTVQGQGDTSSFRALPDAQKEEQKEARQLLAARFVESAALEDLMQSSVRSAETEVHSPADTGTVHPGSTFRWTAQARPPFELTLLDNKGGVVKSFRVSSGVFVMKDSLRAGLYYWKLVAEGHLLHVGKFTVR